MSAALSSIPTPSDTPRVVTSTLLGDVTVDATACYTFPEGLHGFETEREFVLLPSGREGFWWLQSAAEPGLLFMLADPFLAKPGYAVDLGQGDIAALGLTAPEQALVLTVVTLPATKGAAATTNLRGPIVFNTVSRVGRQVVSAVEGHGLHVEIGLG